jgi:hypothetical protein
MDSPKSLARLHHTAVLGRHSDRDYQSLPNTTVAIRIHARHYHSLMADALSDNAQKWNASEDNSRYSRSQFITLLDGICPSHAGPRRCY